MSHTKSHELVTAVTKGDSIQTISFMELANCFVIDFAFVYRLDVLSILHIAQLPT